MCIDYIIICAVPRPWTGLLSQKLKPQKLILKAFSNFSRKLAPTNITHLTVHLSTSLGIRGSEVNHDIDSYELYVDHVTPIWHYFSQ